MATCGSWVPSSSVSLVQSSEPINGIVTGADSVWVHAAADRTFSLRHAYRPLDNRWVPSEPPAKARRGAEILPGQAPPSAWWRGETLFNPHAEHRRSGGWYLVGQFAAVHPGPALHATREIPNHHLFKGSEASQIIRVASGTPVPPSHREWADSLGLTGFVFWQYMLAAAHHIDYWTGGTEMAAQLAERRVEPPLTDDAAAVRALVELGAELVAVWSVDSLTPASITGRPGQWHFAGHNDAEAITPHDRNVLETWRNARPGPWDQVQASDYGRTVTALLRIRQSADEVARLLG